MESGPPQGKESAPVQGRLFPLREWRAFQRACDRSRPVLLRELAVVSDEAEDELVELQPKLAQGRRRYRR